MVYTRQKLKLQFEGRVYALSLWLSFIYLISKWSFALKMVGIAGLFYGPGKEK